MPNADLLVAQRALGADQPLRDRRFLRQKRARDLADAEAADQLERQRHARVGRRATDDRSRNSSPS